MEKDLNMAKQLIMYTNDAVEATFSDGTKIYLSPCATEYVVQQGNHTQGKFNHFFFHLAVLIRSSDYKTSNNLYNKYIATSYSIYFNIS
jgi:hypothetical protein